MDEKRKILVVDDEEVNRDMLIRMFRDDYMSLAATDGTEALEILKKENIDLVLLDLDMPQMDGYQVIEEMKNDTHLSAIPIVVTTGAVDKSERRALDLGADDYIEKPYDPYTVHKRVDNLIQKYVLQVKNLKQALGQAEKLNKSKSEFLSRMSHDLRSPINSIISLTTLLDEQKTNPARVQEMSGRIHESAKYLLSVVSDILDASALENKKVIITKAPFNFRNMMESVAELFYGQCQEKDIRFKLNLSGSTEEYLFGDPMRLKEVLVNLVSNAVKFTPNGGEVSIRVTQTSRVTDMVMVRFDIMDTGVGIAEDRFEKIFEPYTQETAETARKHGGSGLGLAIVKDMVELMGGTVNLESEVGKGSKFSVEIPFAIASEMHPVNTEKLKHVKAIIIDDDIESQQYGQSMMKKLGINCESAMTGAAGLEAMEQAYEAGKGFDICFIDWRMPGMSGLELTRKIRTTFDDDTLIVVASAYDLSAVEEEAKMSGANVVVPKPMFQSTVFDLLMNMTGGNIEKDVTDDELDLVGMNILLAEDNTLNAEVEAEILRHMGCTIERVRNGREAVEMFTNSAEGHYQAILMDIQMPILDGHEATKQIRSSGHPEGATIPIIAVTAQAFLEDVRNSRAVGMNDHISKPIDNKKLHDTLKKYYRK